MLIINKVNQFRLGRKSWERNNKMVSWADIEHKKEHSKAISSAGIAHKKKKETTKLFPGWALAVQVRTDDFVPPWPRYRNKDTQGLCLHPAFNSSFVSEGMVGTKMYELQKLIAAKRRLSCDAGSRNCSSWTKNLALNALPSSGGQDRKTWAQLNYNPRQVLVELVVFTKLMT